MDASILYIHTIENDVIRQETVMDRQMKISHAFQFQMCFNTRTMLFKRHTTKHGNKILINIFLFDHFC